MFGSHCEATALAPWDGYILCPVPTLSKGSKSCAYSKDAAHGSTDWKNVGSRCWVYLTLHLFAAPCTQSLADPTLRDFDRSASGACLMPFRDNGHVTDLKGIYD